MIRKNRKCLYIKLWRDTLSKGGHKLFSNIYVFNKISKMYKIFTLDYHTLNHFRLNLIIVNINNNNPI